MLIKIGGFEFTEVWDSVLYKNLSDDLDDKIPNDLRSRVLYIENACKDIWEWSEKVYQTVKRGV